MQYITFGQIEKPLIQLIDVARHLIFTKLPLDLEEGLQVPVFAKVHNNVAIITAIDNLMAIY